MHLATFNRNGATKGLSRQDRAANAEPANVELLAIAGGSPTQNAIAANIVFAMKARLWGFRCMMILKNQRVFVPGTGLYTYPDVSMSHEETAPDTKSERSMIRPRVLVEVLSTPGDSYIRWAQFAHYRTITSIDEYLLVSPDAVRVQHCRRVDEKQWLLTEIEGLDSRLIMHGVILPLREIYANVGMLDDV